MNHPVVRAGSGREIRSGWMPMNSEPIFVLHLVEEADRGMLMLTKQFDQQCKAVN